MKSLVTRRSWRRKRLARLSSVASTSKHSSFHDDNYSVNSDPIDFLTTPPKKPVKFKEPIKSPLSVVVNGEEEGDIYENEYRAPPPQRQSDLTLIFERYPQFTPNLTPEEVLRAGSFGGTFFKYVFNLHNSGRMM